MPLEQWHPIPFGVRSQRSLGGMPMTIRHAVSMAAIFGCVIALERAIAQPPPEPPEFLSVESSKPISIFLRPRRVRSQDGRGKVQNQKWYGPYKPERIRLPGYQPIDIAIHKADGTSLVFAEVPLCQIMKDCQNKNWVNWNLPARGWRLVNGQYQRDRTLDAKFRGIADRDKVRIELTPLAGEPGPVGFPGTGPPPPPDGPKR